MIPGHPAGSWCYEPEEKRLPPPTAEELGEIFRDQDALKDLTADAWLALRRSIEGTVEPVQFGELVCTPDDDEFNVERIDDMVDAERFRALQAGDDEPTPEELSAWRTAHIEAASMDEASGHFAVHGWEVRAADGETRLLVTLHGDRGSLERVAGLWPSVEAAAAGLREFGRFQWLW
jgi:hypothetical protein